MFGKLALLSLAAATLASCAPSTTTNSLRNPATLASACEGRDGWADPAPPAQVFGNTWYVGTCGITVLLVTSPNGHILIDSGPVEAVPQVLANIRKLGFDPRGIRWIVASHEHFDHVGGLPALKAATGANVAARAQAAKVLESGLPDQSDPQFSMLKRMAPVRVDRVLGNGEVVAVGRLQLTAHATPAHSAGSTSWTWRSCEGGSCIRVAYADSVSTPAAEGYRFAEHPQRVGAIRQGFANIASLPCDLLITPHPAASKLFARFARQAPLVDPEACRAYAATAEQEFATRLANEPSP